MDNALSRTDAVVEIDSKLKVTAQRWLRSFCYTVVPEDPKEIKRFDHKMRFGIRAGK